MEKRNDISYIYRLIRYFRSKEIVPSKDEEDKVWNNIMSEINASSRKHYTLNRWKISLVSLGAAAMLAGAVWFIQFRVNEKTPDLFAVYQSMYTDTVSSKIQILAENRQMADVDNDVTSTLIVNKLRGTFNVVATKAPEFGDNQKNILEDIAILTGAKLYSKDLGMELKNLTINDLGRAKKITITKDNTTIIDGEGNEETVKERINELNNQALNSTSEFDKKKYQERAAKLSGGVALIKVGATTESELKEKKLRIEDALNATKAAVSEGIVVGGGAALISALKALRNTLKDSNQDVQKGISIVLDSLTAPLYQIAENAGYNGDMIVEKQLKQKVNFGFDAKNGKWVDMFKEGIVDPTKVTRSALLNASSISALFITTEAGVSEIKKDEKNDSLNDVDATGMY